MTQYSTLFANVVLVAKKDGKIRICVYYRDLNKASHNNTFSFTNSHIRIDNCSKHKMQSFVDCYASDHQIRMNENDVEKTTLLCLGIYIIRG